MWRHYLQPATEADALDLLAHYARLDEPDRAAIVAGGTDVLVEYEHGRRATGTLIDISALTHLKYIREEDGVICLGGLTTHNDVIASAPCVARAFPLAQACWEVGAPQLRTRATVAGNLATASPANDTITPLIALDADLLLVSRDRERVVPLREFYLGVRKTVLQPDELINEIRFPAMRPNQRGIFLKLGRRRAQAIAVINLALVLTFDGQTVVEARIALGSLAPTIVRAEAAERALIGRRLDASVRAEAARLAREAASPIGDVRGSADYRLVTLGNLVEHGLQRLAAGTERADWPTRPVLLDTGARTPGPPRDRVHDDRSISLSVNGEPRVLPDARRKTLLDALREDAGLTGAKEGCAEGECGACTVWLDGQAVMSCLVPAPQAAGATVTTIEGLTVGSDLHPLQSAFIDRGAVQCGYCIPGMLMAGAKLLDERPAPDLDAVRVGLSGNLCRCTGYRKIFEAVLAAGAAR